MINFTIVDPPDPPEPPGRFYGMSGKEFIFPMKREKAHRLRTQTSNRQQYTCRHCGGNHRDARSTECPQNRRWTGSEARPLKRNLSATEKTIDKEQKGEGSRQLRLQHRNEDASLCQPCSRKGRFDRNEVAPHHSTGSSFCPDHSATKDDVRNKIYGSEHTLATRKVSLDKIKLNGDNKDTLTTGGALSTGGTVDAHANIQVGGNLKSMGMITAKKNVVFGGKLTVIGGVDRYLIISANLFLTGELVVMKHFTIGGNIMSTGLIVAGGNIIHSQNANINAPDLADDMHTEYAYDNTQYDEHDDPVPSISINRPSISQSLIKSFHDIQSSLVTLFSMVLLLVLLSLVLFSLALLLKTTKTYTTLPIKMLKGIHRIPEDGKTFGRVFNLGAVRLARGGYSVDNLDQYDDEEGALGRKMPIFNNLVSTDGYAVDVSLIRPTAGPPLPDLKLEDFTPELVNNHFRLWGIDPGMTQISTADDGSSRYLKYSKAEWRAKSGITRRLTAQRQRMTTQITDIQSQLPTTKTASVQQHLLLGYRGNRQALSPFCLLPSQLSSSSTTSNDGINPINVTDDPLVGQVIFTAGSNTDAWDDTELIEYWDKAKEEYKKRQAQHSNKNAPPFGTNKRYQKGRIEKHGKPVIPVKKKAKPPMPSANSHGGPTPTFRPPPPPIPPLQQQGDSQDSLTQMIMACCFFSSLSSWTIITRLLLRRLHLSFAQVAVDSMEVNIFKDFARNVTMPKTKVCILSGTRPTSPKLLSAEFKPPSSPDLHTDTIKRPESTPLSRKHPRPPSILAEDLGQPSTSSSSNTSSPVITETSTTSASTATAASETTANVEKPSQKNKGRCFRCRVKVPLAKQTINKCKCDYVFCDSHRFPERHDCGIDYAKIGRDLLAKNNPKLRERPKGGTSFHRIDSL
ncbi:hypothetical protein [Absidia glauca]|uniref:AN1-type domain-containing protein n=1 Tax=Absidia glauca TaxID=4829 RepID=A0A170APH6_ABSGL|nr:hypothetical protein [Absidia glauca]